MKTSAVLQVASAFGRWLRADSSGPLDASVPPTLDKLATANASTLLEEAMGHIRQRRWGSAQRSLERLGGERPGSEPTELIAEVRAIRRCLRQLEKRPREAILHVELGRLYFGLELGDDALASFSRAAELEPDLAIAHHLLALEYLYRGNRAAARRECEWAHALEPDLPSFTDLLREFEHVEATA
ncbi:MAG: tetratricopeptide repeat protein [Chloroflexota bacterium]